MRKYHYAKTNNLYYCLKQNAVVLAWVLFFIKSSLDPVFWPSIPTKRHEFLRWSKNSYQLLKVRLQKLIVLLLYKYHLQRPESSVLLPVYGHVCKPAHKGYKIFDFRRKRVVKIFDENVDRRSVAVEIDKLRSILQIDFAPSIRRWNIEEYWYEEDYIDGFPDVDKSYKPILDSAVLQSRFEQDIVPCMETIMLFQEPIKKDLRIYVDEITRTLGGSGWFQDGADTDETKKIRGFLSIFVERLHSLPNSSIFLLFTHGDFCSANILNAHENIKIIDWEHATHRSALFDFYSYFFYRPYRSKISTDDMVLEIDKLLPKLVNRLHKKSPDVSDNIILMQRVYRWLYYIERISMLLEREMTDTNLNIKERIMRFIEVFSEYEIMCPDNVK